MRLLGRCWRSTLCFETFEGLCLMGFLSIKLLGNFKNRGLKKKKKKKKKDVTSLSLTCVWVFSRPCDIRVEVLSGKEVVRTPLPLAPRLYSEALFGAPKAS